MLKARVYVITVNYKGAEDTANCLASLQESSTPVKTVVVDNTPNDPKLAAVLARFSDVHLVRAPENLGFGGGNNLGIEWALEQKDCDSILILNNDATIEADAIQRMQEAMGSHPEAAIVTARIVLAEDETKLWYGGGEISWKRGGAIVPGLMGPSNSEVAMASRKVGFASGCVMLIRKDTIGVLGGFDPLFFMYEEDVDLCLRARKFGYIYYEAKALIYHKGQGSQRQDGQPFQGKWSAANPNYAFHSYQMARNTVINVRRHASLAEKIEWLFFYPLFLLKKSLKASAKLGFDAFHPVISGLWDGLQLEVKTKNEGK